MTKPLPQKRMRDQVAVAVVMARVSGPVLSGAAGHVLRNATVLIEVAAQPAGEPVLELATDLTIGELRGHTPLGRGRAESERGRSCPPAVGRPPPRRGRGARRVRAWRQMNIDM